MVLKVCVYFTSASNWIAEKRLGTCKRTMPLSNGVLWRRRSAGCANAKFFIRATGEAFGTKEEMKEREKEYAERKWVCRHIESGQGNLSFDDALKKEQQALSCLRKLLPDEMIAEICKIVHHCFADKIALMETIRLKLKSCFFKGEEVSFTHHDRQYEGKIRAYSHGSISSPSDKENERTYAIEVMMNIAKVVNNVRATSITRKFWPSDDELGCLIALLASKREGSNNPWIVDDEFREQFEVPNKVHSMFVPVMPCAHNLTPAVTVSSSDDSGDEPLIMVRLSSGIAPHSTVANKQRKQLEKESVDKIKRERKNVKKGKQGDDKKTKRKSDPDKKGTENGEPVQKKKKADAAGLSQRGLAKFLITSPGSNSPVVGMTPSKIGERKLEATVAKLTRELIAQDAKAFHNACVVAAKSLSLPLIKAIQNDVLRYAVLKQHDALRDADAMKKMSVEERKEYKEKKRREKKEEQTKMEKQLNALLCKKLEDTVINHKLALPELERVEFATEEEKEQFAPCLLLSEFVNTFKAILLPDYIPSADEILSAVHNGREGFFSVTGYIIVAFLKLLLQDQTGMGKYGGCGVRLRLVSVTLSTASEMARIVLTGNQDMLEREERVAGDKDAEGQDEERDTVNPASHLAVQPLFVRLPFVAKLKKAEFFELSASEQLEALQFLLERVLETDTLDTYLHQSVSSKIANLDAKKKDEEAEIAVLKAELDETKPLNEKSEEEMTRKESLNFIKIEKHRQMVVKKIKQKEESINATIEAIRKCESFSNLQRRTVAIKMDALLRARTHPNSELKVTRENVLRVKPLGSDRFHRRYWFFQKSPNAGIFVEGRTSSRVVDGPVKSEQNHSSRKRVSLRSAMTSPVKPASCAEECSESHTPSAVKKPRKSSMTLEAFINQEITYPDETGNSEWFRILDETVLGKLLAALSDKAYRESYLLSNLRSQLDRIASSIRSQQSSDKIRSNGREEDKEKDAMDECTLLRDEILTLESHLRKGLFTRIDDQQLFVAKVESAKSVEQLSALVLELEHSLYDRAVKEKVDGIAGNSFIREQWRSFVKRAETVSRLCVLLYVLEACIDWDQSIESKRCVSCRRQRNRDDFVVCTKCANATHMHCVRPPITEKPPGGQFVCHYCKQKRDEENESEEEAGEELETNSTDSDWRMEKERDDYFRRSKTSRKSKSERSKSRGAHGYKYFDTYTMVSKNSRTPTEDGPKTRLQEELQEVFALLEEDIRIYNSLIAVPAVGCATRGSRSVSLENIKKDLYSYSSVSHLKSDLRVFIDEALRYFEYSSVSHLKSDLRVFIDEALRYFEGNERKLPQLLKLKSDLKL
ncbi:Tyrosine-protein kinase BAZ1B [Toxocara canis]|uniref:Tyrosine-protein kinase BAZ1B n=1 Tax=Toxocara canis TaxID=6265 RepID=A0A0B2W5Z1_TOXCA|nr:Tyrosine-protein kinase BAZ1B [Toxocara canis]